MNRLVLEFVAILGLAFFGASCIIAAGGNSVGQPGVAARPPLDAVGVIERFRERGLPIGDVVVFTAATDGNNLLGRPNQYTAKATWRDTRLPRDYPDGVNAADGGTVETFATEADARTRQEYVGAIAKTGGPFAEYAYREGTILIRLSRRLTPEQAAEYETALRAL